MLLEKVYCNKLKLTDHRRGVMWESDFYHLNKLVFHADNDGCGGSTRITIVDKAIVEKLRKEAKGLFPNDPEAFETIASFTEEGESLMFGVEKTKELYEEIRSIGGLE